MITRRQFLGAGSLSLLAPAVLLEAAEDLPGDHPLASFDHEVEAFRQARHIPGGALALVKDGRLVYARGYGWADREKQSRARPDTLFRIASISKPFTAVTVFRLWEAKRLDLNEPVFDLLDLKPLPRCGAIPDPRLKQITVWHLLHHTGGWDRGQSGDPMFRSRAIAQAAETPAPAMPETIIRYMLGQPLDFDPGTRSVYSNFGYCVLGRVIEKVTGVAYEKFVQEHILAGIGIQRMSIGASLTAKPGESRYYTADDAKGGNVFGGTDMVPEPYGAFCLEAMDSHGGWIASAVDLARFAAALDVPKKNRLLEPATLPQMYAPPNAPVSRRPDGSLEDTYYACGWMVRPHGSQGQANCWHNGSLPGTFSILVRRGDGLSWAALFNQRSRDANMPDSAIDGALHRAANAVKKWPKDDLFSRRWR